MDQYEPSISFLRKYHNEHAPIFKEYFAYHCKDTQERHLQSIQKYPDHFSTIEQVHNNILPIINEIVEAYAQLYRISFPINVHLIVGGFGSNAYAHRQIIPNITFALEQLSPEPSHLKAIVAHEFGHAAQNIVSNHADMDWKMIQWDSPLIWLLQEGAATHFSRQTAPRLQPSIYFSFNESGDEWLRFCITNQEKIKAAFAEDYVKESPRQLYREWFSIKGGQKFGYHRLGYFVADMFFQDQMKRLGEMNAITAWSDEGFVEKARTWLCR